MINKLYRENLEIINDKEKQDIELEIIKEKIINIPKQGKKCSALKGLAPNAVFNPGQNIINITNPYSNKNAICNL